MGALRWLAVVKSYSLPRWLWYLVWTAIALSGLEGLVYLVARWGG